MKPQTAGNRNSSADQDSRTKNPFDVMDVPDPNDQDVLAFAVGTKPAGTPDNENANAWALGDRDQHGTIEGHRSSRWSGGPIPPSGGMPRTNGSRAKPK
jgi:hypothetical protein